MHDEFFETRGDSGTPLPPRATHQQRGKVGIAGNVTHIEHGQAHRDVGTGDL